MRRIENVLLLGVTAGLLGHALLVGCDVGSGDARAASIATVLAGDAAADPDCGCAEPYEAVAIAEAEAGVEEEAAAEHPCPHVAMKEAHERAGVEIEDPDGACPYQQQGEAGPARQEQPAEPRVDPAHSAVLERAGGPVRL